MVFISNKNVYISFEDDFLADFLKPNISKAKHYKRISGYFTSSFIDTIYEEIISSNYDNGLKIQIICSPDLPEEDKKKIIEGYDYKRIIENNILQTIDEISLNNLNISKISELIIKDILDIRFIINRDGSGIFHAKIGIFINNNGDEIGFTGSNNETAAAIKNNFEITHVVRDKQSLEIYHNTFDSLWNNKNSNVYTFKPTEKIINTFRETINEPKRRKSILDRITLHSYQNKALEKWIQNKYKGMLEMATGTGKTITALACHDHLLNKKKNLITL
ncbi:MAG TPA: phospholipase D-like domain-containing protein [Aliicoccus persicus]|uniref:Phospholipase D-like domain-containing protein n=1 Tax=Aliicoccus persicus TaxID=930138 RepID=A0A921JDB3_9STAP|nr:phospholipase D-like domain-containing protein [Aliicoccus persicus]